jgi:hypothetical protein
VGMSASSYDLYSDGQGHLDKLVLGWYPFRISLGFFLTVFSPFYLGEYRRKKS